MSTPVEEIQPKVSEISVASGEVRSISWPIPQPVATGMYVTKDDRLVVQLLGPMGGGEIEAFIRIFTPGTGIQVLRQRIKLPLGGPQAMYWVNLTEGWITNISVNVVPEAYAGDVLEVRLGLQRGWSAGEFPILWFAAGFMDFYRGFHWPETHYLKYNKVEFTDYIDTVPGTAFYYEWINTTGYDVEFDAMVVSMKNNDTVTRYPMMEIRSNERIVARQIVPLPTTAGATAEVSWIRGHISTTYVQPIATVQFPFSRPFQDYEGFRVYFYGEDTKPTFNAVRAVYRKIVR